MKVIQNKIQEDVNNNNLHFKILGKRLFVEFWDCNSLILNDADKIREALINAAKAGRSTIIDIFVHKFSPKGITGTATLAESHICIHTWPEYDYAAIDIFMCGKCDPYRSMEFLNSVLHPGSKKMTDVDSSIPSKLDNI